ALLSLAGASAWADIYTPSSDSMSDPKITNAENDQAAAIGRHDTIVVVPDEDDYAFAKSTTLNLPFHIEAETSKNKWRIKESFIIIGLAPLKSAGIVGVCCGSMVEFDHYNYAVRIEHGNIEHVDKDAWWKMDVGDNSIGHRARNACRNMRKDLENQGFKYDEIFGQDRNTTLPTEFRYVARVAHKNDNHDVNEAGAATIEWKQSQPIWPAINVICQKKAASRVVGDPTPDPTPIPTGGNDIVMGFQVNQAALAITPKHYEAKCPAKLHLNPTIEATGKGTVRYRFVDQLGHNSQEFQVTFDKSDVKFLDHVIEIDGKGKPKGLGFAAAQAQGGALGLAASSDPNLTQGYFQLEVTSPHKKLSNFADYSVKCTVQTAGDGLVAKPDVVKPVVVGGVTAKPDLADLFIDSVQPSPAVPTKLFVKVTNKGTAASKPTNLKALRWVGSQSTARGTLVPVVEPGQSQVVLAELGGTIDGATQLYVRVDDPNRIKEQDESNNSFKVK
ncbi:MAG: CARDB domain-containing protein, partial [Dongiaceae bacterium]